MVSVNNQNLRAFLINSVIIMLVISFSSSEENSITALPSIEMESPEQDNDLRRKFLKKKHENYVEKKKIVLLEKKMPKTFHYDGIPHFEVKEHNETAKVKEIETAFRKMIAMQKVKYIYNRGDLWRTWREVKYPSGKKEIYCYHCHSSFNATCPKCHLGGYWLLDDALPPCPYEIFSVKSKTKICVANTKQLKNYTNPCPETITFDDLMRTCNNPIETEYRMTHMYGQNNRVRRSPDKNDIFCLGRETCKILTSYVIKPELVVFRIINKTSNVIKYSRVMKNDNSVFACTDDCGIRDPVTKKINNNEQPLVVNLLEEHNKGNIPTILKKTHHKNKRESNTTKIKNKTRNDKLCSMEDQKNSETDMFRDARNGKILKGYSKEAAVTKTPCCKNVTNKYDEFENGSPEEAEYHYDLD